MPDRLHAITSRSRIVRKAGALVARRADLTLVVMWHKLSWGEARELVAPMLTPDELARMCDAYGVPLPPEPLEPNVASQRIVVPDELALSKTVCRTRRFTRR